MPLQVSVSYVATKLNPQELLRRCNSPTRYRNEVRFYLIAAKQDENGKPVSSLRTMLKGQPHSQYASSSPDKLCD